MKLMYRSPRFFGRAGVFIAFGDGRPWHRLIPVPQWVNL